MEIAINKIRQSWILDSDNILIAAHQCLGKDGAKWLQIFLNRLSTGRSIPRK